MLGAVGEAGVDVAFPAKGMVDDGEKYSKTNYKVLAFFSALFFNSMSRKIMKLSKKIAAVVGASLALTLVSSPAFAAPWTGSDILYPFGNDGSNPLTEHQYYALTYNDWKYYGLYSEDMATDGVDENLFDDYYIYTGTGGDQYLFCDYADPLTTVEEAADGSGDIILTCAPEDMTDGVTLTLEFRMYADAATTRARIIVTNNTPAAVTDYVVGRELNMYVDSGTNVGWSSLGGSTMSTWPDATGVGGLKIAAGDTSYVITAPPGVWGAQENHQPWYTALGATDGRVKAEFPDTTLGGDAQADDAEDSQLEEWTVPSLAVGESAEIVIMNREYLFGFNGNETASSLTAANAAVADAEAAPWSCTDGNQVLAGIADKSKVLNWCPAATPELPDTGVDTVALSMLATGATLLSLMGVAFVIIRRRRNA